MTDVAFIVEGEMEMDFIKNICPGKIVLSLGCNGDSVAIEAIIDRVWALTEARKLLNNCRAIVVIFDREDRIEGAKEIEDKAIQLLQNKYENSSEKFIVCVADKMTENWILSDSKIQAEIGITDNSLNYEGKGGKNILKSALREKFGQCYKERLHGVKYLKMLNPHRSSSESLRRAMVKLESITCWWTSPNRQ